jgi:NADH-quinone oxidoreductase subunit M
LSIGAVALPLTSSFVGEFLIIMGAWRSFPGWTVIAMGGVVLGAVYTLTAYLRTMFGPAKDAVPLRRADVRGGDALVLATLVAVVVALGVFPGRALSVIESAVSLQVEDARSDGRASPSREFLRQGAHARSVGCDEGRYQHCHAVVNRVGS